MTLLPKVYTPTDYEEDIYYKWESSGYFNPDNLPGKRKKPFSISLPLPNVTGKLHIGHSAMLAYQDLMIRYHRLKGDRTLWLPGMDHAAIATQSVVGKELNKEGKSRFDLGREKFLERINQFVLQAKIIIRNQLKAMGASLDWSREKFTLDKDLSKTVRYVFKRMYDDGLIYRGDRVVNWCPKCQSTLSDDEVEYKETKGQLYYIKYGPLTIATTRPETKLGDTGVAVNPQDERYKDLVGQELDIDLADHKIRVKVFADRAVDINFGTGAIGVTPAHSQQDFFWSEQYKLPIIKIIDEQGKMTDKAGKYQGLLTKDCREQLIKDLEKAGLIEEIEDYINNLSVCYRCNTAVEPLTSLQWFVDVNKKIPKRGKSLKQLASEIVKNGKIKIIPERFNKTYFQWMDNLRDWCISRQIWYGHQIPVWYGQPQLEKEMGFYEKVVPQVFAGKTKTYRLRDHQFIVGDEVDFENSQTGKIFGQGKIINIKKTTVDKIDLQDRAHGATYKRVEELIKAFKKHYPEKDVKAKTPVFIYEYQFIPKVELNDQIIVPQNIIELVLMRHGVTDWNKEGNLQGQTDVPLDESSIGEIKALIPRLKAEQFDLIISSSMMRARQTAEIINQALKLPLETSDLLAERNYGSFESKKIKEIKKEHPAYVKDKINYDIPGEGEESYQELAKRVEEFIQETNKKHPNQKILIICHNAVIRTFKMVIDESSVEELSKYKPEFGQLVIYYILDGQYKLKNYRQDPDTLDTWFSSALWTFSTLGWPIKTNDLKIFHPTSVMETGYDILFFWVARMIMMSTYLLKERPFETVYLHGLIRTKAGEKMSKSKPETCIDPLEMIKKFGADALRLSLIIGSSPGNDVRLYDEKIAGYRNFVNKLWNISRYILDKTQETRHKRQINSKSQIPNPKTLADKWILFEFNQIIESTTKNIEEFRFSSAGEELYEFTWSKLADWYLEIAKIEGEKDEILLYILERLLILWHPFCPYVTEVLWEEFKTKELLMVQQWPKVAIRDSLLATRDFKTIKEVVTAIRNIRSEHKIDPKKVYSCSIQTENQQVISNNQAIIEGLAKVKITPKCSGLVIHTYEAEIVLDITQNKTAVKNQQKEIVNLKRYIEIQEKKLVNKEFIKKAPKAVVEQEKEKLQQAQEKLNKLIN